LGGHGAIITDSVVEAGSGSTAAIDLHATLTAHHITVRADATGLRLTGGATATVDHSTIVAGGDGVTASSLARATLIETDVDAALPSRGPVLFIGNNQYSHQPLRWIAVAALIAVAAGLSLEILRRHRDRRLPHHGAAPEHVLNAR
jgi:hypothetical protein